MELGKYRMKLEHFAGPESRDVLKEYGDMSKRWGASLNRLNLGQFEAQNKYWQYRLQPTEYSQESLGPNLVNT